jgi:hypothetical protein
VKVIGSSWSDALPSTTVGRYFNRYGFVGRRIARVDDTWSAQMAAIWGRPLTVSHPEFDHGVCVVWFRPQGRSDRRGHTTQRAGLRTPPLALAPEPSKLWSCRRPWCGSARPCRTPPDTQRIARRFAQRVETTCGRWRIPRSRMTMRSGRCGGERISMSRSCIPEVEKCGRFGAWRRRCSLSRMPATPSCRGRLSSSPTFCAAAIA